MPNDVAMEGPKAGVITSEAYQGPSIGVNRGSQDGGIPLGHGNLETMNRQGRDKSTVGFDDLQSVVVDRDLEGRECSGIDESQTIAFVRLN